MAEQAKVEQGKKFDAGKLPWHLFPWKAATEIVRVLAFGATKYGERNWERGMSHSRLYGAAIRHLTAYWDGQNTDPETGLSHLAHAGCCILFWLTYSLLGLGTDDRPVYGTQED